MKVVDVIERAKLFLAERAKNEDGPTRLLRLIFARADSVGHCEYREEIVAGVASFHLTWVWLEEHLKSQDRETIMDWAAEVHGHRWCQLERHPNGLTVWLRSRFELVGD